MSTAINTYIAREHGADLRRAADRKRMTASRPVEAKARAIELRRLNADEADVIARLAALDDAPELEGPVLLAVIDGVAAAGLSLHDGRVVANPFVSTSEAVALLRLRAEILTGAPARRRRMRFLAPRAA